MDGFDLSAIDQLDQDIFNATASDSDDCEEMPVPECIGLDSALQDEDELKRRKQLGSKSRTDVERDLELKVLRPDSIRRQILEQSMSGNDNAASSVSTRTRSHVMNISEKAGMKGIDRDKINQIIHDASKGSHFYRRQAQRQAEIHRSIQTMLTRINNATDVQIEKARVTCDNLVASLEEQRQFNRVIVHFDLDMFFAAVEIRDNPELKDKPIAVGGNSMVSTSNYIARRFGVRAAMPGFIAKKLCPELVLIKPNGYKYRQASSDVFSILEQYDPELTSMSLDEAYLDLTEYVKNTLERDNIEYQEYYDGTLPKIWWTRASEVVVEIRDAIFEKTKLTCSAGIACNTLLAKISTDINKPNGQYMVQGYSKDVNDFISKTPIEKVSGIGKVSAQFLNALDIKTCGDILEKRHFLPLVFYEINVKFYLRVALGDGPTSVKSDEHRKSKSVERTFTAIADTTILLDKLDSICDELCSKYLKPYRIRGRTVTLKLKRNTFTTTTRSYSMLVPTNDKLVLYSAAKNLLMTEIANKPPEISYRLIGVKLSNLADDGVATNQLTIDAMLRNQELGKASTKSENTMHQVEEDLLSLSEGDDSKNEPDLGMKQVEASARQDLHQEHLDAVEEPEEHARKSTQPAVRTIKSFFGKHAIESTKSTREIKMESDDQVENSEKIPDSSQMSLDCAMSSEIESSDVQNQKQSAPMNEANDGLECPYCYLSFKNFSILECHVKTCKMKIPIDVNRSFVIQRSRIQASPASAPVSQTLGNVGKVARSSQASRSVRMSSRIKKQPRKVSPFDKNEQSTSQASKVCSLNSATKSEKRLSFYERFLKSNSQSLEQSVAADPFQCPYCLHGFIAFSSLESHVYLCTKRTGEF